MAASKVLLCLWLANLCLISCSSDDASSSLRGQAGAAHPHRNHRRAAEQDSNQETGSTKNEEAETVRKEAKEDRVVTTSKPTTKPTTTKTNSFLKNVMDLLKYRG
jgi:hypothetical protein